MPSFAHGSPSVQFVARHEHAFPSATPGADPGSPASAAPAPGSAAPQAAKAGHSATVTPQPASATRQHYTTCSLDCPDSCRVIATEDLSTGRLVRLAGDPAHPVTRGFLCGKVARYLDRVYAPDRLLYPMRRRPGVPKAQLPPGREHEAFERISWDAALSEVAVRLQQVSAAHGPESILPYSYAGTIGQLGYGSMDRRFFHRLGASQLDRTICAAAGAAALTDVYGTRLGMEPQAFARAKLILAWGANVHGNNIHLWPFIEQARRNGARLVVLDPYQTRTARLADLHLRPRPGTDVLLAMGLMHVILRDGLQNDAYIQGNTHGFEELRERVLTSIYAPETVARITGLAQGSIEQLAHEYATTIPAAIRVNYGVQRSEQGGSAVRAISMLPLLTGAWQHAGGGLLLSTSAAFPFNGARLHMPELMHASPLGRDSRTVNMSQLGHALTQQRDPPVQALFVYNSNPAAVAPNQAAVLAGMRRADLFTVVHDVTFTDTADYADILLPAPTFLEQTDIQGAYGHYHLQLSPAAIAPLGEARPNVAVFAELARRMGFPEPCFHDSESDLIDQALDTAHPWFHNPATGSTVIQADLRRSLADPAAPYHGFVPLQVPRNVRGEYLPFSTPDWFRTPTGRGEFSSSTRADQGLDPLPAYIPGQEGTEAATPSLPLQLLPRKADHWMNSTFANLPAHQRMQRDHTGFLELHAVDAAPRNIVDGDAVSITSARGSLTLTARISTATAPGVVAATLGWNKLAVDGRGINMLTAERLTDIAGGATFYSTLVQVTRLAPASATAAADPLAAGTLQR